jgi:hypothetical protein
MAESKDYTIDVVKVNIYALGLFIPIFATYLLLYSVVYGFSVMVNDFFVFFSNPLIFLISLIVGAVLHEMIHAICWSWLDGIPWNNIQFGFKWKTLTPYVHCPVPVEVNNYRWGVAMPCLVLGIIPYTLSLIFQNGWLLGFGLMFTVVASGDILMLWLLRCVKSGKLVQDHPDLMGCQVINPNQTTVSNE